MISQVPGDFVEAGVFKGGIAIVLAACLRARGLLGDGEGQRRVYLADSYARAPP